MRVLLVKMSSMGDILHTFPALTDALRAIPNIRFDWIVEEAFQELPSWHPAVDRVLPIAWRRWRRQWGQRQAWRQWWAFHQQVKQVNYDVIIDAQGLLKSAMLGCWFSAPRKIGLDRHSAREGLASLFYRQRIHVPRQQHAIMRTRQLMAAALGYSLAPEAAIDYAIDRQQLITASGHTQTPYVVLLHGTTWPTKHWPESYWTALAQLITANGLAVHLPWGNADEKARALRIAKQSGALVLPKMSLTQVAEQLAASQMVIAVDTGLGHMAAALAVPTISLYGPTNPDLTGALGPGQQHVRMDFPCAPCLQKQCHYQGESVVQPACFAQVSPSDVWCRMKKHL